MKTNGFAIMVTALGVLSDITHESITHAAPLETAKPLEPPAFWTDLANDEKVETWRRAVAIYFLFDRHVKQEIALEELAGLMNKPKWIKEEDFVRVGKFTGSLPLPFMPGDSLFRVRVFPNKDVARHNKECFAIFLYVTGKIDKEDVVSTIVSGKKGKYEKVKLKAWAISPTWAEYLKRASP